MKKDFIEILYENRKLAIIIMLIVIICVALGIYIFTGNFNGASPNSSEVTIDLRLFGKDEITLELGEKYEEPGYYAVNSNGIILTKSVQVINNLDINKVGTYTIFYKIDNIVKKRVVIVQKTETSQSPEDSNLTFLTISLKGEKVITLSIGEKYIEPGYEAISKTGENITNKVTILGEVDTMHEGTYTLLYKVSDGNTTKEVVRTIIVLNDNLKISITPNKTDYTNTTITLTIKVTGNNFFSIMLPNQVVVNNAITTYDVNNNGTYTFKVYNKNGKVFTKSITINTIDKIAPNGSCSAIINQDDKTKIQINATDDLSGIQNYYYYANNNLLLVSTKTTYNHNSKVSNNVYVTVYDKAGNFKKISCSITDNSIPDRSKNKIILIGDSRTEDMCKSSYCNACQSDKVFAKVSMGYSWLVNTAIPETDKYLNNNSNESYNIFILLGVNGIGSSSSSGQSLSNKYFNTVKDLAVDKWKNQYIYYVSVNPVTNSNKLTAVNAFNSNMKGKIANSNLKNLKYCDTASKLTINSSNSPDGVHYNCTTYRKIRSLLNDCL